MNELDCVRLTRDFEGITAGTEGAIVYKHNDEAFEVEFINPSGETIGVYTISKAYLEVTMPYVQVACSSQNR